MTPNHHTTSSHHHIATSQHHCNHHINSSPHGYITTSPHHSRIALAWWRWWGWNRTKPYVFSRKVPRGVDVGNLVCVCQVRLCAGMCADVLGRILHAKVDYEEGQWDDWVRCDIVFGDPGLQFALLLCASFAVQSITGKCFVQAL